MNYNRIITTLTHSKIIPPFWNAYLKGRDANGCIRNIIDNLENSIQFNIKTITFQNDIDSASDGFSRLLINTVLKLLGFGYKFFTKYGTPI